MRLVIVIINSMYFSGHFLWFGEEQWDLTTQNYNDGKMFSGGLCGPFYSKIRAGDGIWRS